jgi:hypothetical protein
MRNAKMNLSDIGGVELNNRQKSQLTGGEELDKCYWCVCLNCVGEWVTKASSQSEAEAKATKYCESEVALCSEVNMEQCAGIGGPD